MLRKTLYDRYQTGISQFASMRPQRNAAENRRASFLIDRDAPASMRPQRNAAENSGSVYAGHGGRCRFNEAAA